MKTVKISTIFEYHPDFSWFVIPTIEIDVFEKRCVVLSWLCFSITFKGDAFDEDEKDNSMDDLPF